MIIPDLIQILQIQENLMVLSQDYKSIFKAWIRETFLYWMPTSHHVHDTILEHVMAYIFDLPRHAQFNNCVLADL